MGWWPSITNSLVDRETSESDYRVRARFLIPGERFLTVGAPKGVRACIDHRATFLTA
jgi:hypothetical protein